MKTHIHSLVSQLTKPTQTLSTTRILHALIIKNSLTVDPFYATKILRLYAINNDLLSARNLFDKSPERSVYLWNSIIRAHAQAHHFGDTFLLFKRMLTSQTQPDNFTFACLARACSDKLDTSALRAVHGKLVAIGLGDDFICISALVSSYSKMGLVEEASFLFNGIDGEPDLVLCNAMASCYGRCGDWTKGVELFKTMMDLGIRPDGYTVVGLITGLKSPILMNVGEMVHSFSVKCGLDLSDHVGSALVGMYSRCGSVELARKVLEDIVLPDVVSWSALIAGFSQSGDHVKALMLFKEFVMSGCKADPPLLATALAAIAHSALVGPGCEIHGYALRHGIDTSVGVSSALVDMYAKCGFLEMGIKVFERMPRRNIVSFNTVILGLGLYGRGGEALRVFDEVLEQGMRPDETTFAGILCACCHSGLVEEGIEYFKVLRDNRFGVEARTEHYVYMVKLLGMDGRLGEAYDLVRSLPEPVDSGVWGALLSCCEYYKNYEVLEVVAKHFSKNERISSGDNVMLSNSFACIGRWECVEQLRADEARARGKLAGSSWISS